MSDRCFCIHGHFYQPSREDPLTGLIPDESGSEPYANWNERVNDRCYRPNAEQGNFSKVSFNMGPTLVRWMEGFARPTLSRIIESDRTNVNRNGVGNAMAQPYHHTILPLATRREKEIQVRWGIADFKHTFGRTPEGMWLPEAAVDMETLSILAEEGIHFTILPPWAAKTEYLDTRHPYRVALPNGREIVVFFYNDSVSCTISFNPDATTNAENFIDTFLRGAFTEDDEDQLVMAASDGELYGHHQAFRDFFLAYLLDGALSRAGIQTSYPALWLKTHVVKQSIEIRENTSWSCCHGVERWAQVCGCTPSAAWKKGLRDFLRATAGVIDDHYGKTASQWVKDPGKALEEIILFVLHDEEYRDWEKRNAKQNLTSEESRLLRKLMQAQFERQRMFTSCGWFFEQFDRIEPNNNLKYAAQALALSEAASDAVLADELLPLLKTIEQPIKGTSAENYFSTLVNEFRKRSKLH